MFEERISRLQPVGDDGLTQSERRIAELEAALKPFADAHRRGDYRDPTTDEGCLKFEDFVRAAELVPK